MKDLKNKVILITGAGQGLGAATMETLAEAGAIVVGGDIQEAQVKSIAEKLRQEGKKAEGIFLDVTDEKSIDSAFQYILQTYTHLDAVINNAGIDVTKPIGEISINDFDKVVAVNLKAPWIISKKAFEIMGDAGGNIINIASTAAKRAWANASAYHGTKWGLLGITYALHVEGRTKNIKVSAIVAGGMRTPFILERFPDTPPDVLQEPKNVAEVIKFVLMQPDESVIPEVMVLPFHETSWP